MSYTYANRKRAGSAAPHTETETALPAPDALRAGAAKPTAEQMGHRVDLPDAMRAKMESAFGADLSAVKLYESEAVADAGAEAVTQGSNIAFAPGMLDFSSYGGQALLGHEISHVVSQSRGEVTGGGFLNDHALEARADREGAMAAAGQTVAMPAAAVSGVTAAPAAGPMQAKKGQPRRGPTRGRLISPDYMNRQFAEPLAAGNRLMARQAQRHAAQAAAAPSEDDQVLGPFLPAPTEAAPDVPIDFLPAPAEPAPAAPGSQSAPQRRHWWQRR